MKAEKGDLKNIVILHGWGVDGSYWQELAGLFKAAGYKTYTPDLPGFGKAKPPPREGWSVRDYTEWLKKFLQHHSLNKCHLIGHSFGGRIAIKFSSCHPNRIGKLILIAPAGVPEKLAFRQQLAKFLTLLIPNSLKRRLFASDLRKFLYRLAGVRDYLELTSEAMRNTFLKVIREDLTADLTEIKAPTLIIWGTRDSFVPYRAVKTLNLLIANSELKVIKGADHAIYRKQPALVVDLVRDFLERRSQEAEAKASPRPRG